MLTATQKAQMAEMAKNYLIFQGKVSDGLGVPFDVSKKQVDDPIMTSITTTFADLLFLKNPEITVNEEAQEDIDAIIERNDFFVQLWNSAVTQSWAGRVIFEVRLEDGLSIIEEVSPENVIIERDFFTKKINKATILFFIQKEKTKWLFKKIHTIGKINYELWECDSNGTEKTMIPLSLLDENIAEEEDTNIDVIPVFQIINPKDAKHIDGVSDYEVVKSLLREYCRACSQIPTQLSKHADAKIAVPPGVLDENGQVANGNMEVIEVSDSGAGLSVPQYITNSNPLIESAFRQRSDILEALIRATECSFVLLDIEKGGGVKKDETMAESAMRAITKVKRKQKSFEKSIVDILKLCYFWETNKTLETVSVKFGNPLPTNEQREVNIQVQRYTAGLQTRKDAIYKLDGLWGEELEEKLKQFKAEESSIFGN